MDTRFRAGDPVGYLRNLEGETVLDYSGIVVDQLNDRTVRVRFSDESVQDCSTHPDYLVPLRSAYAYAAKFIAEADPLGGVEPTEESFRQLTAGCVRRPDAETTARALWVLRNDPAGARRGSPVGSHRGDKHQ